MANTKIPVELSSTPGIVDGSNATAITIDSSENVGVGNTSPAQKLDVSGHIKLTGTGTYMFGGDNEILVGQDASGYYFATGNNQDVNKTIYIGDNASSINFHAGNAERARILSSGGITFNGDTATANALDDYEEGSWTPTLPSGGSITVNTATYTKVGRKVTAYCFIQFTATNNTSIFFIGGLPYNTPNNGNYYAGGSLSYSGSEDTENFSDPLVIYNGNDIYFHYLDGTAIQVKNNQFAGRTVSMITQVHYEIS